MQAGFLILQKNKQTQQAKQSKNNLRLNTKTSVLKSTKIDLSCQSFLIYTQFLVSKEPREGIILSESLKFHDFI